MIIRAVFMFVVATTDDSSRSQTLDLFLHLVNKRSHCTYWTKSKYLTCRFEKPQRL
jgi:hypothetical protein